LTGHEFLCEHFDFTVGVVHGASFPTDDDESFEGEVFEEPLVIFCFFEFVGQPVCDVIGVAFDGPIRSLSDEGQEKKYDEENTESVPAKKCVFHHDAEILREQRGYAVLLYQKLHVGVSRPGRPNASGGVPQVAARRSATYPFRPG